MNVSLIVGYLVVAVVVARYTTGDLDDDHIGHVLAGLLGFLWPCVAMVLLIISPFWLIGRIAQVGRK